MSNYLFANPYIPPDGSPLTDVCVMIHGIFGMSSNLLSLARAVSSECYPIIYDLPNHGRSPSLDPCGFVAMARLLNESIDRDIPNKNARIHVLGHSMGGKVAMVYALLYSEKVASVAVLDIAPVTYPPFHRAIINGLHEVVDNNLQDKKSIVSMLSNYADNEETAMFLSKNFDIVDGKVISKLRIDEIEKNYDILRSFPTEEMKGKIYARSILFLRAERTDYFNDDYYPVIEEFFPSWELEEIADSGHNIHIENPIATREALQTFYQQIK